MKVRIECGVRISNLSRRELSPNGFVNFLEKHLHCSKFQPTQRLSEALTAYGRTELFVDGSAELLLERPSFTINFVRNQIAGMGITKNLLKTLEGKKVTVLFYEGGALAIVGRQFDPKQSAQLQEDVPEILEIIQQEMGRDFPSRLKVDLDQIEIGGLWSGSNQSLMAEILRKDGFRPSADRFREGQSAKYIDQEDPIED